MITLIEWTELTTIIRNVSQSLAGFSDIIGPDQIIILGSGRSRSTAFVLAVLFQCIEPLCSKELKIAN